MQCTAFSDGCSSLCGLIIPVSPAVNATVSRGLQQHGGNGGAPASRGAVAEVITASILGGDRGSGQPAFSVRAS